MQIFDTIDMYICDRMDIEKDLSGGFDHLSFGFQGLVYVVRLTLLLYPLDLTLTDLIILLNSLMSKTQLLIILISRMRSL